MIICKTCGGENHNAMHSCAWCARSFTRINLYGITMEEALNIDSGVWKLNPVEKNIYAEFNGKPLTNFGKKKMYV